MGAHLWKPPYIYTYTYTHGYNITGISLENRGENEGFWTKWGYHQLKIVVWTANIGFMVEHHLWMKRTGELHDIPTISDYIPIYPHDIVIWLV
jgi:hypothetical protein